MTHNQDKGQLYICPTPIGNLDDMSFRMIKTLKEVDFIAAEDTRRTGKLLEYYEINNKLISYHEHNEKKRSSELIYKLTQGLDLALVSDAGMPGISDPGQILISRAVETGIEVIPIPGPTAAISALVASGLGMDRFVFEGFIPRSGKEREEKFQEIQREERTVIIYESPHRVKQTLQDLSSFIKERKVALVREVSKIHEEKLYGTCAQLFSQLEEREVKGEIVLVIAGRNPQQKEKEGWEKLSIVEHVRLLMKNGYPKKKAIKEVARLRDLPKSEVYDKAVVIDARAYLD